MNRTKELIPKRIQDISKGDYFHKVTRKGEVGKKVFEKGDYDRSLKRYECTDVNDICNFIYLKSNTKVMKY